MSAIAVIAAVAPAAASAGRITIESAKVDLGPGKIRGWAEYCPPGHKYLGGFLHGHGAWTRHENISGPGVTVGVMRFGDSKLALTYTNWDPFSSSYGQIRYVCESDPVPGG